MCGRVHLHLNTGAPKRVMKDWPIRHHHVVPIHVVHLAIIDQPTRTCGLSWCCILKVLLAPGDIDTVLCLDAALEGQQSQLEWRSPIQAAQAALTQRASRPIKFSVRVAP